MEIFLKANPDNWSWGYTETLSTVALCISLIAAFLTMWNHKDSAGRVKVNLQPAAYVPSSGAMRFEEGDSYALLTKEVPKFELCRIVIENPGRTGATVTKVQIRATGSNSKTSSLTPRGFTFNDNGEHISTSTYFRIEPFDQRIILFDFWSAIKSFQAEYPKTSVLSVSASVSVAGHSRATLSHSKGNQWRVHKSDVSYSFEHSSKSLEDVILSEVVRRNGGNLIVNSDWSLFARVAAIVISDLPKDQGCRKILMELLQSPEAELLRETAPAKQMGVIAFSIEKEIADLGDQLIPVAKPSNWDTIRRDWLPTI